MLIRDHNHPHGYHVERHPPRGSERFIDWVVLAVAAIGCGLVFFLMRFSNMM